MRKHWISTLIPGILGLSIAGLWQGSKLTNPILYARMDTAMLVGVTGIAISLLIALVVAVRASKDRQNQTALASFQQELYEQRRRFLLRLDHELKNPLTAVRAGLANLAGAPEGPDRQTALTSVESQVVRLSRLTGDLRKLAELETLPLDRTPVDIPELMQQALSQAEELPESQERQLSLTLPRAPWPLPEVHGDRDLLLLAVYNLVDNALKFTRPGDTVEIRAFEDGDNVVIEVADTGPGIPEAEQPLIWEELYRGKGARGIPGSGLGLSLTRAIIERHEGEMDLRSRQGAGTVVTVRLPTA